MSLKLSLLMTNCGEMASVSSLPRIQQLVEALNKSVARLQHILATEGLPHPSFEENASFSLPPEAIDDQDTIIDAASELRDLLLDPLVLIRENGGHNNSLSLQAIARYGIAGLIPPGGRMTFSDISRQIGLSEDLTRRLLRHAMTMRVFSEPQPGVVAHTAASRLLSNPSTCDWLRVGSDEMWPAAVKTLDALHRWPDSSEPNETGFSLANNTSGSVYEVLGNDPVRAARFGRAMEVFATSPGLSVEHMADNYDWASMGHAQIVDVGGGQGHVASELAERFPNLNFIVQDLGHVVEVARSQQPDRLRGKVQFMAHDLFATQSIQADMLIFRWVLHNWSDKYCIKILSAQIPALKPGTKIMIQDGVVPQPGERAFWREKYIRSDDLSMASCFNSKERTASEWEKLLVTVDPRFRIEKVIQPKGSVLAMIIAEWMDGNESEVSP